MTNWIVSSQKCDGYTLIEVIVVLLLISILAVFAIPRWAGTTINLDAQSQQLLSDLRYTQNLAMTQGKRYRLNLISPNTYTITDTSGTAITNPSSGTNAVTLKTGISYGSFTHLPNSLVAFNGKGIPYTDSSATTALSDNATIVLTSGPATRSIVISPGTGRAVIQ